MLLFDHFKLDLQWSNSFYWFNHPCQQHVPNKFTIHGLWPDNCSGSLTYCSTPTTFCTIVVLMWLENICLWLIKLLNDSKFHVCMLKHLVQKNFILENIFLSKFVSIFFIQETSLLTRLFSEWPNLFGYNMNQNFWKYEWEKHAWYM